MADTIRTLSALATLLADNTTGDISPQDLRDLMVSLAGCYGGIEIVAGSTGQTLGVSTIEVLTEWTGNTVYSGVTPDEANNKITIPSGCEGDYLISFNASFHGIATAVQEFSVYKNGGLLQVGCQRYTSATDVGSCGFNIIETLAASDYLEIWVESDKAGDITVDQAQFNVRRLG